MEIPNPSSKEKIYTTEEYHKLEELAVQKHEFANGKLIPMPGGSSNHADIIGNMYLCLRSAAKQTDKKFRIFNSELKIYIPAYHQNVYPDASVIEGKPIYKDKKFSIVNPIIIVEVLSDSTAKYDRGQKFLKYKSLSSFKEYVLIDQDAPMVDVITKRNEEWVIKSYVGLEEEVILETMNCKIAMADIYEDVDDLEFPQSVIDFE